MAESPVITCPECKKKFKGKGNLEGKKIKCPLCANIFVVPAASPPKTEAPAAPPASPGIGGAPAAATPSLQFADEDEDDNPNPYGVTELDIAPRCPNCAQEMADDKAFICLYCGYNTLTREIGKTEKLQAHTQGERFKHLLPGLMSAFGAFLLIALISFYNVVVPGMVEKTRLIFLDHESLRMWFTIITLSMIWPCGFFAYKRLIVNPTPSLKRKE